MNCFQLVKAVLDDLYEHMEFHTECQKDQAIRNELDRLSILYANLSDHPDITYSDPVTQFAYIYRYVTAHANMLFALISRCGEVQALFDLPRVNIACLGGGPGSDFLGILKHVISEGKQSTLSFGLYDREPTWGDCWHSVYDTLQEEAPFNVYARFQPWDVCKPASLTSYSKVAGVDLFTMLYFLSEVYSHRDDAESFFTAMFNRVKSGALLIYVDNDAQPFYGWFDEMAQKFGLEVLDRGRQHYTISSDEDKLDLGCYFDKFGHPRLTAKMAYRICRKPTE